MDFKDLNEKNQPGDFHQVDLEQYKLISKLDEDEYFLLYKATEKNTQINLLVEIFKKSNNNIANLIEKAQIWNSFN